ncbi:hypothetical protein ACVK1X_005753 [Pseudomonas sp. PvR086]|jgi:hypothetical protein|uniref:hypothetical protein n=1 Tax=Pseudomonas TaxID=286 RepID=UPI000382C8E7|nr:MULTISPECIES: hypothetical protein [Pseudomonas]ANI61008.1 hypothetical protein PGR6_34350 [Pseudomonas sp. GR 6-02]MBD9609301.1 hypothetical protein [Pseudomonas sp. PDM08]MDR7109608.1 hypothetical protein [Pseudomonas frederiksbergensis]PMY49953.1 hypothetical protein C1X70_21155 [Pseudomonas sp. FW305-53]PMY85393.1 hypothetical protein C1X68_19745 [Pseudomonas sp. FW303-C2]
MNNDDRVNDVESETTSNTPPTDPSDEPIDVVDTELEDSNVEDATATRTQKQEAEERSRKIAEIERKVADGN